MDLFFCQWQTRHRTPGVLLVAANCAIALAAGPAGCVDGPQPGPETRILPGEFQIPTQSEWTERGILFEAGQVGEWDHLLYGGFTTSVVKRGDSYHIYYQGSDSLRTTFDQTVCHRAIGLAMAGADLTFTKYTENPVLTWAPNDECEEGAVAGSAALSRNGDVILFYGANTIESRTKVSADIRIARSPQGFEFVDGGKALDHLDPGVWGHGDEIFPLLALQDGSRWIFYYVPNGTLNSRRLGVAWGSSPTGPFQSAAARGERGGRVPVWGTMGSGRIGAVRYALFLKNGGESPIEVRLVSLDNPQILSEPVQKYRFNEALGMTVMLDEEAGIWLMVYQGRGYYGLKTAPATRLPAGDAERD